jgi:hypothetical protein
VKSGKPLTEEKESTVAFRRIGSTCTQGTVVFLDKKRINEPFPFDYRVIRLRDDSCQLRKLVTERDNMQRIYYESEPTAFERMGPVEMVRKFRWNCDGTISASDGTSIQRLHCKFPVSGIVRRFKEIRGCTSDENPLY